MPKLTKRALDALKPGATDCLIFDDEVPRFGVRVMPSGVKSYLIQYRKDGRTRRYTFGKHGLITPDEARAEAKQLLASVDRGVDPSQKRKEHRTAPSVADLCQRFLAEYAASRCKESTQRAYRRAVEVLIIPRIGSLKAADVQRKHITEFHHDLRQVPYQANGTLKVLSKMFNLAEVWGIRPDGSNPCRHVERYREDKRERFLSADELGRLGTALADADLAAGDYSSAAAALRLLLLTGCRLKEIQTLRWEYIQGDVIALPDSKTGAKNVMLGRAAIDVLAGIPRIPDNPFVISGKRPGSHLADLERPWRKIREQAGLPDVRIHDLRHTFASNAVGIGESLPMIGKLLGHNQVQTTARYAHLANNPLRSAADRISANISAQLFPIKPDQI